MAVGHHAWRDGARRWRLDVLVDDLTRYVLAVAFAVRYVDVIVLIDVVAGLVDRAVASFVRRIDVVIRVFAIHRAILVDGLVHRGCADIVIEIAVCIIRCAVRSVLVNVVHCARVHVVVRVGAVIRILVYVRSV